MENKKLEFKASGVYFDGARRYEIQISSALDVARYRMTTRHTVGRSEVVRGRWQKVRRDKKSGYAYITMRGKRLYFRDFKINWAYQLAFLK